MVPTDTFARQVVIDWDDAMDGMRAEDNYFDLRPLQERRISLLDRPRPGRMVVSALNATPVTATAP